MRTLQLYLDQKNKWNAIFGGTALVLGQDNQKIANMIDSELSPENLTCDGELSRTAVAQRYKTLTTAARELQTLDNTVTFYEFS
jgi:hypothetical protein